MDSSDDDIPIGARPVLQAASTMIDLEEDSDVSGSPMPDWLSQHTPTQKGVASPDSNDSDKVVDLSSPVVGKRADPKKVPSRDGGKCAPGEKQQARPQGDCLSGP